MTQTPLHWSAFGPLTFSPLRCTFKISRHVPKIYYTNLEKLASQDGFMRRFLKLPLINATWNFYGSDKNRERLETQLIILKMYARESAIASVSSIKEFFNANGPASFSETATCTVLVKLILVMPATNALSERSFSVKKESRITLGLPWRKKQMNNLLRADVYTRKTRTNWCC